MHTYTHTQISFRDAGVEYIFLSDNAPIHEVDNPDGVAENFSIGVGGMIPGDVQSGIVQGVW